MGNETAVTGKPLAEYDRYVELLAHVMANGLALATEREFLASLDLSKPLHEVMRPHALSAIQWRFAHDIDEIEAAGAAAPVVDGAKLDPEKVAEVINRALDRWGGNESSEVFVAQAICEAEVEGRLRGGGR